MTLIVTGGYLPTAFLKRQVSLFLTEGHKKEDFCLIAADRGAEACASAGLRPAFVVGDFDSLQESAKETLAQWEKRGTQIVTLPVRKDDTDTEAALRLAMERTDGAITILGGTGSRLDHVLGNLSLLRLALQEHRDVQLIDPCNRIRMTETALTIKKAEQYGGYVSIFPCGGAARVTLEGFAYPLRGFLLEGERTIGVSNEIAENEARILVESGRLLVIESRDRPLDET